MNRTARTLKTQRAMASDKKGIETMSDILTDHRQGKLPPRVYFKDDRGKKRIDLNEAWLWKKHH